MSENSIKNLTYGAVEDIDVTATNPYAYAGYCKKLGSDEICEIEVFINDKLVDTLKADKLVASVDKTYSCGNHCFMYEADEALFDKDNVIRFKHGGEDILGSPMDMKYNEHCFIQSLKEIKKEKEKLKSMFTKGHISFFIVNENLNNTDFIQYVKKLLNHFPDIVVNFFYFTNSQKALATKLFENELKSIKFIIPRTISDVIKTTEIFVYNTDYFELSITAVINKYCQNIYTTNMFFSDAFNYKNKTLKEVDEIFSAKGEIIVKNPHAIKFFTDDEIKQYGNSYHKLRLNSIFVRIGHPELEIDLEKNAYDFYANDCIKYILTLENFKELFNEQRTARRKALESK